MNILSSLKLTSCNRGASTGADWWSSTKNAGEIISYNPATAESIASVYACSFEDYDYLIENAQNTFLAWRVIPAPKRGELVRLIGEALRQKKEIGQFSASNETTHAHDKGLQLQRFRQELLRKQNEIKRKKDDLERLKQDIRMKVQEVSEIEADLRKG